MWVGAGIDGVCCIISQPEGYNVGVDLMYIP